MRWLLTALIDSKGRKITLGDKIARGGEGTVFKVPAQADMVAKVYHRSPTREKVEKLSAMAVCQTPELVKLACWPVEILSDSNSRQVQGFLMPNSGGHKEIHKLYSPKSRATEFQSVDWRFLLSAASNVAKAFAVVHRSGHIIGDVNHSSVMIAPNTTVRLIDCDSFQINTSGKRFLCEVAEPLHTPPELQARSLQGVIRTVNHDNFGLAVLIFELLFMGRHPFAGAFSGSGDLPLEQKIARRLFAYGTGAGARQMKPPPNTLALEAIPSYVSDLFIRAFVGSDSSSRPTAAEWVTAISALQKDVKVCQKDQSHYYYQRLAACPWCEIEGKAGISLFSLVFAVAPIAGNFNLALVWDSIQKTPAPHTKSVPNDKNLPTLTPASQFVTLGRNRRLGQIIGAAIGISLGVGGFAIPSLSCAGVLIGGVIWAIISSSSSNASKQAKTQLNHELQLAKSQFENLRAQWHATASINVWTQALKELETKRATYEGLPARRKQEVLKLEFTVRELQLHRYLDNIRIKPGMISGIGDGRCTTLYSYGIETAADVNWNSVYCVPGFGDHLTNQICAWRKSLENGFHFDPSKGVDPRDIQKIDKDLSLLRASLENDLRNGASHLRQIATRIENAGNALTVQVEQTLNSLAQLNANIKAL